LVGIVSYLGVRLAEHLIILQFFPLWLATPFY
jgi:hypothetical protein